MAKKPVKAKAAKKIAKPTKATKPVVKAKPSKLAKASKPAKSGGSAKKAKASKPAAKPAKKVVVIKKAKPTKVAKTKQLVKISKPIKKAKAVKPAKVKKAVKPIKVSKPSKPAKASKPTKKAKAIKPAKLKKIVKVAKPVKPAKAIKVAKPAKGLKVAKQAKAKVEKVIAKPAVKPVVIAAPIVVAKPLVVENKVEALRAIAPTKTVEQQMQERVKFSPVTIAKGTGKKEELFVPKYQLPAPVETFKPMRTKPVIIDDTHSKPVANPIYIAPGIDGKAGLKFAPMAIVERAPEKDKKQIQEDSEDMKTSPRLAFKDGDDKKGGISIENKLRALYDIQLIDTRIDKIHAMRGELPLEVEDLEAEVEGLETRIKNLTSDLKGIDTEISNKKLGIKDSENLIKKYKEQLNNVKNNREFDSLNKETEFQDLEIQLHTKRIKEFTAQRVSKDEIFGTTELKLKERKTDLKIKKNELAEIIKETEKEEKILRKKGDEARKLIEERLLGAYERIRSGAPNKMAVVPIEREASAGSFIQLPPQKQLDVAARKRVIVDEHSGRILVDAELAREEQEKMNALLNKELGR